MSLALVDCNNFFASCERIFNPKLENKPIVVLSGNDGCVIARSEEAKKLAIAMGAPAFMLEKLFKKYDVHVFSSNFSLYLDISSRVMQILSLFTPSMQVYSIDEAFLSLEHVYPEERELVAQKIREQILSWTGITVSIGIAATKTLAKVANHRAKKSGGVCTINETNRKEFLENLAISEVWGIGAKLSERLQKQRIYTAWQLQQMEDAWIKKELSVVGLRLAWELRGISCLDIQELQPAKKSISSAKSFEKPLGTLDEIGAVLASYTSRLGKNLRQEKKKASFLQVMLPDSKKEISYVFPEPTNYTPLLIGAAKGLLKKIFEPGLLYKRVGVSLGGFISDTVCVQDFFSKKTEKKEALVMKTLDAINERFGKKSLFYAAEKERAVRCLKRTSRYTTRWDELLIVYAS